MLATGDISIERYDNWSPVHPAADSGIISIPSLAWYARLKGVLDVGFGLVLLIVTAPVVLIAACLVKLTSRGPMFYSQIRLGRNGRPYSIYKLRTMYHDCERCSGPRWSTAGDPRITPVGWFLRRTHLDELPQLWNVVCGEMSLVGPRPERPEFAVQLAKVIPNYTSRLLVQPGVTGLAQVQLPADTDIESVRRKLVYDLYYVRQLSFWLDVKILLSTVFHVLSVPFAVPRILLRVPSGAMVERAEPMGVIEAEAAPQLQSA
jgi:lipopolysaccharide/colanic/teichoic acid biosynthesis glycosyltransferase